MVYSFLRFCKPSTTSILLWLRLRMERLYKLSSPSIFEMKLLLSAREVRLTSWSSP